ncbi:hypothetical protein MUK42_37757 [Musa troglodytarum]|uniref:Uncharacterized protein n=1 Tax=Musa troglodytarum TaxID=320322 RepID=A0A9E7G1I2_9LILI|nr:hypothetical protein MUK42_37757 [Musa troglodytarum]
MYCIALHLHCRNDYDDEMMQFGVEITCLITSLEEKEERERRVHPSTVNTVRDEIFNTCPIAPINM